MGRRFLVLIYCVGCVGCVGGLGGCGAPAEVDPVGSASDAEDGKTCADGASATIHVSSQPTQYFNSNMSGFNYDFTPMSSSQLADLESDTQTLQPQWLRFPAGTGSLVYDWVHGEDTSDWEKIWNEKCPSKVGDLQTGAVDKLRKLARAGIADSLDHYETFAHRVRVSGLVVCVNAYSDVPESAETLAGQLTASPVPAHIYELANEPYLYTQAVCDRKSDMSPPPPGFWVDGGDYATQMWQFAQAVKRGDANAKISLFVDRRDDLDMTWLHEMQAAYSSPSPSPYWDVVSVHDYLDSDCRDATEKNLCRMTFYNNYLDRGLAPYYTALASAAGKPIVVSEFDAGNPQHSPVTGSLYDGIYAAEYILRLSTQPGILYVGMQALTGPPGIRFPNDPETAPSPTAQINAVGVANNALMYATAAYQTRVDGGSKAPALDKPVAALYAQAYQAPSAFLPGSVWHVVVTNKSCQPNSATILLEDQLVTQPFEITQVESCDGKLSCDPKSQSAAIKNFTSTQNPVQIPPYSVVDVAWYEPITYHK